MSSSSVKYIDGKKEYMYDKCRNCRFASFQVVPGLHPAYGWWIQVCDSPSHKCIHQPFSQLSLF